MTTTNHITIGNIDPRIQYRGDGTQRQFAYPFPVFENSDLQVFVGEDQLTTGFRVSGAGDARGGTVTLDTAPAAGVTVTLRRIIPIERTTDFQEGGIFRAKVINDELDRMTAQIQQVDNQAKRVVKLGPTDPADGLEVPLQDVRAGKLLGFDDQGNPVAEVTPGAVMTADQSARDAETARDEARASQDGAQTARQGAEVAQTATETARDQAETYRDEARNAESNVQAIRLGEIPNAAVGVPGKIAIATEAQATPTPDNASNDVAITPLRLLNFYTRRIQTSLRIKANIGVLVGIQVFSTPGVHIYSGWRSTAKSFKVTVIGGGGSGSGGRYRMSNFQNQGGQAGGIAIKFIDDFLQGNVTVTVGAGGVASGDTGNPGGASSFGTYCSATGGGTAEQGETGVGVGGDLVFYGKMGRTFSNHSYAWSYGGDGLYTSGGAPGYNGTYGSGGGSKDKRNNSHAGPGNGGNGLVILEEYA